MIHILTLNWNGLDKLKKLENGLIANLINAKQEARWYVRDNGSKDGSAEWIDGWNGWRHTPGKNPITMVPLLKDHNRDNFAQGVNSLYDLIESADDDFILLLNNDIQFKDKESLKKMIKLMDNSKIGVVGARLLYNDTNKLQHAGVIFGERYGRMPYHFRHGEESNDNAKKNRFFQAVTAACCLIKSKAFKKLDEELSWAFEDIDLNLRIGEDGWKIAYCGETEIFHEESASLKKNPVNKLFLSKNVAYFKKKWFGKYELDHEKYLKSSTYNEIK